MVLTVFIIYVRLLRSVDHKHLIASSVFQYTLLVKASDQFDIEHVLVHIITVICLVLILVLFCSELNLELVLKLLALAGCVLRHILAPRQ